MVDTQEVQVFQVSVLLMTVRVGVAKHRVGRVLCGIIVHAGMGIFRAMKMDVVFVMIILSPAKFVVVHARYVVVTVHDAIAELLTFNF
jgi:hypothetical protein